MHSTELCISVCTRNTQKYTKTFIRGRIYPCKIINVYSITLQCKCTEVLVNKTHQYLNELYFEQSFTIKTEVDIFRWNTLCSK
jgi:hypothetical protein